MKLSTKVALVVSAVFILSVFLITEHPISTPFKATFKAIGIVDYEYIIRGATDVRSFDHILGEEDSETLIIEYSDFSCFFCATMREIFKRLRREEDIRTVYRHFYEPTETRGIQQAIASECVAREVGEDAFWEYIDILYLNQAKISKEFLLSNAVKVGASALPFQKCLEDPKIRDRITKDSEEAKALGAAGTPFILFVHKNSIVGFSYAGPYNALRDNLEDSIQRAK